MMIANLRATSENPLIFEFERDFAGSLRCIPMIARQKLDLVGIKMTLRQWSQLPRDERFRLLETACDTVREQAAYHTLVEGLIINCTDEPVSFLSPQTFEDWRETNRMPDAVSSQAKMDGVLPPTTEQWAELTPLQRFALIKLARSEHENANFVPALREFGLLPKEVLIS